ncbi:MAG: ABC transporter ATP-binding protein [Thermodesulfobacteriota bacterium]
MSDALIRFVNVVKKYNTNSEEVTVLNGLNLKMAEGEFVAIMGPSGSGKTTILNLIAGIDGTTDGQIFVGSDEISAMTEGELARWRSRHVGFIFQFYNLIPALTAFENIELPLLLTPLTKSERKEHVETALEIVGLTDRRSFYPRQLSGGQEQRVGIARAIVTDPAILLADEPTGDLDAKSAEEILFLIENLNKSFRKTIVMVTHDQHAADHASRIIRLDKGLLGDDVAMNNNQAIHN